MMTGVHQGNPTSIRLPDVLRNRITEKALRDRRSVNQTVIILLELALELSGEPATIGEAPAIGESSTPVPPGEAPPEGNEGVKGATRTARRGPASRRAPTKMCEHRVPSGTYCKQCEEVVP